MRKLIDIPDQLAKDLKKLAIDKDVSFKKLIEESLVDLFIRESNRESDS